MKGLGWFLVGGLTWTVSEYAIHRFVGHGPKRKRAESLLGKLTPSGLAAEFNAEHLDHHADPSYFAPTSRKLLAAGAVIPTLATALSPIFGVRSAASFALGLGTVYGAYEVMHRRAHTHAPTGPYSRWMRRHHLHHHHRAPRSNHGVTTPFWDVVFGSLEPTKKVRIPRHVAPVWLVDPVTKGVRPEFAEDYELVGKATPSAGASVVLEA